MEQLLLDLKFTSNVNQSDVGNFNATFTNIEEVEGPSTSLFGKLPKAIKLKNSGGIVNLNGLNPNSKQFCIQIVFKINGNVTARQNIMESSFLPFSMSANKAARSGRFILNASIGSTKHGWCQVSSEFKKELSINKWYTATLAYDFDTLALFVDQSLIGVHGLPNGKIDLKATKKLFLGTWVDGNRNQLNGSLAALKWFNKIPLQFESLLDEKRADAEWYITYKHAIIKKTIATGALLKKIKYDTAVGSYTAFYEKCAIMYHETAGSAFEMHGSIYNRFKSMTNKSSLGFLVTDESKATNTSGRKSIFSKGGIYWSRQTGAIPVLDKIYLEYENLGGSKVLGFPKKRVKAISGGKEQEFQKCRMYYKNGAGKAHEVHGAILAKYLRLGGPRKFGFPTSNESDVKKGRRTIGKSSSFEHCTIYWKSGVGAFEVHGDIRRKYHQLNGPCSQLGFPTSDESNIPHRSGKINTFEKGSILWFGGFNTIKVALPFKIRVQRIHSRENEGFGMGQNDLYFYVKIKRGNTTLYNKRHPNSGNYPERNIINPNLTFPVEIIPNKINQSYSFFIDIRDKDGAFGGDDDKLGNKQTILNAANAWGYNQPNLVFNQSFSRISSLLWSIRPKVNINSLTEIEKWWKFRNFRTAIISRNQYAAAYRDVDSETEWWDVLDGLRTLFYKWVVKGIASGGNCFGMSLEAIYARKNRSLLNQPLNQVEKNNTSVNEINIKHTFQVGAGPIWWFLGQFVTGNTHDPKDIFTETRNKFRGGNNPVICLSQNYDFSGAPHCIMPYAWDTSSKPWKIKVMDPNFPGDNTKCIDVNPDNNTFVYNGSSRYTGGAWSGGRLHYMPFCILDGDQRTPVWDAILLLLSGTILILADDAETVSIKDANGKDLDGNGSRAKAVLKSGRKPEEFFASFTGFDAGLNIKPGQILIRNEKFVSSSVNSEVVNPSALDINTLLSSRVIRGLNTTTMTMNTNTRSVLGNRSAHHILNDTSVSSTLNRGLKDHLKSITKLNNNRNFIHEVKGSKNGKLEYLVRSGLTEIKFNSTIKHNEKNTFKVNNLNTNACHIDFKSPVNKTLNLEITRKLGVKDDYLKVEIDNVLVKANKAVSLNLQQGISGLEIANKGVSSNLPIKISGSIDGKKIDKSYTATFKEAIRIKPSTSIQSDDLMISNITKLFGTITSTNILNKL
ncbi:hypothetical protein [Olleya sp. YS]|uniref:LGFP repeat-containing protein n=1 Tax=Olleya sp. YS TaxID=3028318 RepID=UPI0024341837|nr:hypothetical protein [Olleya sp. YS]WGD34609.1 hypothetical protein Ollyesu_12565 [Olleya sp. YS]